MLGVSGVPVPELKCYGNELGDDDPWIQLQCYLLERAKQEGNDERVGFYRTILRL